MNKVIVLLIFCSTIQVFADEHDWYPADPSVIQKRCKEETSLTPETKDDLENGKVNDRPDMRALLLCSVKGMNVYTTEKGFDNDRLAYALERMNRQCNREGINECVSKHSDAEPEDVKVFKTAKCIMASMQKDKDGNTIGACVQKTEY